MKYRFTTVLKTALLITGCAICLKTEAAAALLPSGGAELLMATGNAAELTTSNKNLKIERQIELRDLQYEPEALDEESFENLVIAQVSRYVNVRKSADEKGEVLGKLYNNSVGEFLGEENGWYLISSGSVTGYVKAEYCVTGEAANELAPRVGTRFAKVTTTTLKVRKEATTESACITMVPLDDDLVVMDETDEWAKVDTAEGTGWVSKEYVEMSTEFVHAESREEEAARLAKEEAAARKAREAAAKAVKKNTSATSTAPKQEYAVGAGSEMGVAVAEYALQFVGNPYVYGGTSLTKGADCSGFVMSVYANFGISLPHSSKSDRTQGYAVDGLENAQPGDLICYSGHVALYIGNGQIVHASSKKTGIKVSDADYKKILAVRRIF